MNTAELLELDRQRKRQDADRQRDIYHQVLREFVEDKSTSPPESVLDRLAACGRTIDDLHADVELLKEITHLKQTIANEKTSLQGRKTANTAAKEKLEADVKEANRVLGLRRLDLDDDLTAILELQITVQRHASELERAKQSAGDRWLWSFLRDPAETAEPAAEVVTAAQ